MDRKTSFFGRVFPGILITALTLCGCGGSGESGGAGDSAGQYLENTLGTSLEDVTATDFEDVLGGSMDAGVLAAGAGSEVESNDAVAFAASGQPPAPPWWLHLYPLRHRRWDEVRMVIEAPAHLAHYVLGHLEEMPACLEATRSEGCPLSPEIEGDSCTVSLDFGDSCLIEFQVGGPGQVLELSGILVHSSEVLKAGSEPGAWDGIWTTQIVAGQFAVTDPETDRSMTYDGKITRTGDGTEAAAPYQWHHQWKVDPDDQPLTLVEGGGDTFTSHGTRDSWVLPGSKLEQFIDTYPTWTPADEPTRSFHRNIHKTLTRQGDSASLEVVSEVTRLDTNRTWTRQGEYTLLRQSRLRILVNGTGQVTDPDGRIATTDLADLVYDLHFQVPVSGVATVTFEDGLIYTVVFQRICILEWQNNKGESGTLNYCDRDPPGNSRWNPEE